MPEKPTYEELEQRIRELEKQFAKREQKKDALLVSAERFETSVENMLDSFGIYSAIRDESGQIVDFRIEHVNAAACDSNQMTRDEQVGKGLCEVLPAHRETGLFDEYCQVVETGKPFTKETLIYEDVYGGQQLRRVFDIRVSKLEDGFVASWRDITDRKQAEEALRREKQLGESIIENAPAGIAFLDNDFVLRKYNQVYADLIRAYSPYTPEQALGMSYFDYVPGSRPQVEGWFKRVRDLSQTETMYGFELVLERDGSELKTYWDTSIAPVQDMGGEVEGILILTSDVTDRKQAEEALRESEERFRQLVEGVPDLIYSYSTKRGGIYYSPRTATVLGYSISYLLNNPFKWRDSIHPDDLEKVDTIIKDFEAGKEFETEYRIKDIHGNWHFFFDRSYGRGTKNGEIIIDGIATDITDRKRVEESLRESEEKYRNLFESIPVGLYRVKKDGTILDINAALVKMFRYPDKKSFITKKTTDTYVVPEERTKWQTLMEENGIVQGYIKQHRCFDNSLIWVEENARSVCDDEGRFQWYDGSLIDITERISAEEKEQALEAQLRQAQKMESIGTLAGGIAHEFNNILGIIIGNTELAIDDVPEWNPAKECLKEIRAASMRAKDVVRHVLSFARKTPVQRKPIQISTIIRDSLNLMRASIPTTIEIRQNIACESETILADPTEINQILMNLCTNSVHALSEETGVFEVSLESINLDQDSASQYENLNQGNFIKLTVKDTGEGIDPEIMDQIFDPYFTTKDIGEGTGMGLAVIYGIVKKHDGAIKASSELGKGTVVEVLFPLIEEVLELEVEEEPQVLPTGTERILFVDDEISLDKMAQQMLERFGYHVVTKTNPKEALALFKAEPDQFDLVITDMAMPHMAGDRLAQELIKIRKDIVVILCTGHSARIDEDRAKELGLAAYVMKPLVTREFAITVRRVLDTAKDAAQD